MAAPVIELRVEDVSRLFDPFDPFPTPSRDLSRGVEDFIAGWARELPRAAVPRLVLHVRDTLSEADIAGVPEAIAAHFKARAGHMAGDLAELFRIGRISLLIGLAVLAGCVIASQMIAAMAPGAFASFVAEGMIILGWVANWRPIEIFLYEWWPIQQRQRLYERLAAMDILIRRDLTG
ncbi:MAG: hypothetical protein JNK94_04480 [Hyphomonadaceae bacterium]|nr:hypothetical protein [Hyphomonadaceae bacterium]MBX3510983.1 hypothetical protein [Hyphomonadaceae bacterium]